MLIRPQLQHNLICKEHICSLRCHLCPWSNETQASNYFGCWCFHNNCRWNSVFTFTPMLHVQPVNPLNMFGLGDEAAQVNVLFRCSADASARDSVDRAMTRADRTCLECLAEMLYVFPARDPISVGSELIFLFLMRRKRRRQMLRLPG